MEAGLKVIYCVGESFEERKAGRTLEILAKQVECLKREILPQTSTKNFLLAYEPVWAIGTGLVAEIPQIQEAHEFLQEQLEMGGKTGWSLLYGGSVKPDNLGKIAGVAAVHGALVGGASLDPSSYLQLRDCLC